MSGEPVTGVAILAVVLAATPAGPSARDQAIDYLSLVCASEAGDELLVQALLDRGAPVNAPSPDSAGTLSYHANLMVVGTALDAARNRGHDDIVEILTAAMEAGQ